MHIVELKQTYIDLISHGKLSKDIQDFIISQIVSSFLQLFTTLTLSILTQPDYLLKIVTVTQ